MLTEKVLNEIIKGDIPSTYNFRNLLNQKFGKLFVKEYYGARNYNHFWVCICDCGEETIVNGSSLKSCENPSCGCIKKDFLIKYTTKHNKYKSEEYQAWQAMKSRCYNEKNKYYCNYGAKGVTVCDEWRDSFDNFFAFMGEKPLPKKDYSLDRKDNYLGYSPENCKWSTRLEQENNKKRSIRIEYNDKQLTILEFSSLVDISYMKCYHKIKAGLTAQQIIDFYKKKGYNE